MLVLFQNRAADRCTPLISTACGNLEMDKNSATQDGLTPLHSAVLMAHSEVVRVLLDAGADKNSATEDGFTPLHLAVVKAHLEVVRVLLDAGTEKNSACKNGFTPLHLAAKNAHLDVSCLFLSFGVGVETNGHREVEVVRLLLNSGADAKARTDAGETALHLALKSGCLNIVRLLLASRVDIDLTVVCCCPWHNFCEF